MVNSSHLDRGEKIVLVVVVDVSSVRQAKGNRSRLGIVYVITFLGPRQGCVWAMRDRQSIISRHIVFTAANIDPNLDGQVLTFDAARRLSIDPRNYIHIMCYYSFLLHQLRIGVYRILLRPHDSAVRENRLDRNVATI